MKGSTWLLRQFIAINLSEAEALASVLVRHMAGGDPSQRNCSHIQAMLSIFQEHKEWLYQHQKLLQCATFSFLRLILDHFKPTLAPLRAQETTFVKMVFHEKVCLVFFFFCFFVVSMSSFVSIPSQFLGVHRYVDVDERCRCSWS